MIFLNQDLFHMKLLNYIHRQNLTNWQWTKIWDHSYHQPFISLVGKQQESLLYNPIHRNSNSIKSHRDDVGGMTSTGSQCMKFENLAELSILNCWKHEAIIVGVHKLKIFMVVFPSKAWNCALKLICIL